MRLGESHDPLVERAFARITGADPHAGNSVRLLKDAGENYPAWLDAIRSAQRSIIFENYIVADDATGRPSRPLSRSGLARAFAYPAA